MREFENAITSTLGRSRSGSRAARSATPDAHRHHDRGLAGGGWRETVDFVMEAEKLGLDICWVAEAWGSDAPSALGYLAARTERHAARLRDHPARHPHAGGDRAGCAHARRDVGGPLPARPRPVRPAGDRGPARGAVRARRAPGCGRRSRSSGRRSPARRSPTPGSRFTDPAARRGRQADAALDARRTRTSRSTWPRCRPGCWSSPARSPTAGSAPASCPRASAAYFTHLDAGPRRGRPYPRRPRRLRGRRGRVRRGRGRAAGDGGRPEEGARLQPRRHGLGQHQLLQRRLQPAGLGRGRGRGPRALAGRRPRRCRRARHRRDGARHHADRHRGHGRARLRVWRDAGVDTVRLYPAGDTLDARLTTLGRAHSTWSASPRLSNRE